MNTYTRIVEQNKLALEPRGLLKVASDLAAILDNPIFGYPKGENVSQYTLTSHAKIREDIFDDLCCVLSRASLPLPPLEPEFYESVLKAEVKKSEIDEAGRISTHVALQVSKAQNDASQSLCNAICQVMKAMPMCFGWQGLDKRMFVAKLNQLLVADSCEPVRPDYSNWKISNASQVTAPCKQLRILIVDDDMSEIAKTLRRLAGWPGITFLAYHHLRRQHGVKMNVQAELETIAKAVIAEKPDIILMDQGIDNGISGSALIPVIQNIDSNIRFVANSGGDDEEQRRAGAYPNCSKGERLQPIAQAIESFD